MTSGDLGRAADPPAVLIGDIEGPCFDAPGSRLAVQGTGDCQVYADGSVTSRHLLDAQCPPCNGNFVPRFTLTVGKLVLQGCDLGRVRVIFAGEQGHLGGIAVDEGSPKVIVDGSVRCGAIDFGGLVVDDEEDARSTQDGERRHAHQNDEEDAQPVPAQPAARGRRFRWFTEDSRDRIRALRTVHNPTVVRRPPDRPLRAGSVGPVRRHAGRIPVTFCGVAARSDTWAAADACHMSGIRFVRTRR